MTSVTPTKPTPLIDFTAIGHVLAYSLLIVFVASVLFSLALRGAGLLSQSATAQRASGAVLTVVSAVAALATTVWGFFIITHKAK
jgi:hypothetical protein